MTANNRNDAPSISISASININPEDPATQHEQGRSKDFRPFVDEWTAADFFLLSTASKDDPLRRWSRDHVFDGELVLEFQCDDKTKLEALQNSLKSLGASNSLETTCPGLETINVLTYTFPLNIDDIIENSIRAEGLPKGSIDFSKGIDAIHSRIVPIFAALEQLLDIDVPASIALECFFEKNQRIEDIFNKISPTPFSLSPYISLRKDIEAVSSSVPSGIPLRPAFLPKGLQEKVGADNS